MVTRNMPGAIHNLTHFPTRNSPSPSEKAAYISAYYSSDQRGESGGVLGVGTGPCVLLRTPSWRSSQKTTTTHLGELGRGRTRRRGDGAPALPRSYLSHLPPGTPSTNKPVRRTYIAIQSGGQPCDKKEIQPEAKSSPSYASGPSFGRHPSKEAIPSRHTCE